MRSLTHHTKIHTELFKNSGRIIQVPCLDENATRQQMLIL